MCMESRVLNAMSSELYFAEASSRFVQFRATRQAEQLQAHFYDPGVTEKKAQSNEEAIEIRDPEFCPCPLPAYENRDDWCPDGSCPPNSSPDFTNVTHLIVHHSAGVNSAADWAAVVRSIWDFHVITRGWSDIGYNWLVAPTGVIYEGRGRRNPWCPLLRYQRWYYGGLHDGGLYGYYPNY